MDNTEDHRSPNITPVQTAGDDQLAPPTSPGKPEVDVCSRVTSPEAGADALLSEHNVGMTCEASPVVSEQERQQQFVDESYPKCMSNPTCSQPYDDIALSSSSSYFGESHVSRLQSFVDSVAAGDDAATSWSRPRLTADPSLIGRSGTAKTAAPCSDLRKPTARLAGTDEPLDLSLKPPARRPDSSSSVGELPFPVPVVPPPLFPLLACRESWIAHWAALAAASLQHSLLFPALTMTSQTTTDTTSGRAWTASSSPRSSSSSSPGRTKMAEEGRRTALTAMESFVQSSFQPQEKQQQRLLLPTSSGHDLSHVSTNRKRRRHFGAEMASSSDEDSVSCQEKRKRAGITSFEAGSVKDRSVSPRSVELSPKRDDFSENRRAATPQSKPEVNGDEEYLSCSTRYDGSTEHPLVSLEKFVGVSTPLFRSLVSPPSATSYNGISSPACRTPGIPARKTPSDDVAMTLSSKYVGDSAQEGVTSRSGRGEVTSGSLGRGFTSAQSLVCCNL